MLNLKLLYMHTRVKTVPTNLCERRSRDEFGCGTHLSVSARAATRRNRSAARRPPVYRPVWRVSRDAGSYTQSARRRRAARSRPPEWSRDRLMVYLFVAQKHLITVFCSSTGQLGEGGWWGSGINLLIGRDGGCVLSDWSPFLFATGLEWDKMSL